jgi:hypothetical protein
MIKSSHPLPGVGKPTTQKCKQTPEMNLQRFVILRSNTPRFFSYGAQRKTGTIFVDKVLKMIHRLSIT